MPRMSPLATIPYFPQPVWETDWIRVQAWDVLVVLGVVAGVVVASRAAARIGRDPRVVQDFAPWVILSGFVFAHLVHVFFYEPSLLDDPLNLLIIWSGVSSFGGFLGAAVCIPVFFRLRRESFWDYADPLALGMAVGWGVARVGCFLAHDHKGSYSDFFLAVDFPGGARHDLGLYDAILTFALVPLAVGVMRTPRGRRGAVFAVVCGGYALVRFFLDFLRATDIERADLRYLGLTPAQYGAVALLGFAGFALWRSRATPGSEPDLRASQQPG
jgi:phosphatidylglycerol:prolipoprotein diacylglycerol transferase